MACQKCGRPTFGLVCAFRKGEIALPEEETEMTYEKSLAILRDAGQEERLMHTLGMVTAVSLITATPDGHFRPDVILAFRSFTVALATQLEKHGKPEKT